MTEDIRVTVYRAASAHVDIKVRPGSRFAEVRVWHGGRWPDLVGRSYARLRTWIPWFSLERQALRAMEFMNGFEKLRLSQQEMRDKVAVAVLLVTEEVR
jgi:hypothetical protein